MTNPMRIAFVSMRSRKRFRKEASFIYRCENLALALSAQGHQTSLLHIRTLLFKNDFDVVVFLRPERSWLFVLVVLLLRIRSVTLVADVDDMLFDPECVQFKPLVLKGEFTIDKARRVFRKSAQALKMMDKIQFSTQALATRYHRLYPKAVCTVIQNAGFRTWNDIPPKPASQRNISYLSGTRTHDRDFAVVAPVLKRLLERHSDLTIRLIGPLIANMEHPRVTKLDKVSFDEYPLVVRDSYILIAPLEDTPFNRCKSALKAIEGAMMDVPTVVSALEESEFSQIHLLGVLPARSEAEWESQLEYALSVENHRLLSAGLRERMRTYTDIDEQARRFIAFVTTQPETPNT